MSKRKVGVNNPPYKKCSIQIGEPFESTYSWVSLNKFLSSSKAAREGIIKCLLVSFYSNKLFKKLLGIFKSKLLGLRIKNIEY